MSFPEAGTLARITTGPHRYSFVLLAAFFVGVGIAFFESYAGIVNLWNTSDTFAHGYLVLPIVLYLIWTKRGELELALIRPSIVAVPFLAGCCGLWLLARLAGIQVFEHFAAVAILPTLVWLLLGYRFCKPILFPLAFVFFGVPAGEFLVGPMMEFTADFTVAVIRLLGIPVYREGLYFSLPTGNWSVVKACSGIRYIIASLTLGSLYAYITYNSNTKRAIFILFSFFMPILANGMRAVIIVLIGHYSDMKLATGVDHLVYGWVWFGVVIFIMFWMGSFFADPRVGSESSSGGDENRHSEPKFKSYLWFSPAIALLLMVGISTWHHSIVESDRQTVARELSLPETLGSWRLENEPLSSWSPTYVNAAQTIHSAYTDGGPKNTNTNTDVGIHLAHYPSQTQDAELVNAVNSLLSSDKKGWRKDGPVSAEVLLSGQKLVVNETQLKSSAHTLLVWDWYYVSGAITSNKYNAKISELWSKLSGGGSAATGFVVYTEVKADTGQARDHLQRFLTETLFKMQEQTDFFGTQPGEIAPTGGDD